ncbi:MAG: DJ-1/PfpI family protein [Ferruginibacter sp.]
MEIVIYIYNGITALDAIGPYEVLSKLPNASVKFVAEEKGVIVSDNHFLKLVAEYDISEIEKADILLIPGSVIGFIREAKKLVVKDWIKRVHKTTKWTVSVCTGSIILASTGLLTGLKASSHWGAIHLLKDYGAIPTPERYVREGKIITSQGVSAGIDMALYLALQIVGSEQAKSYQLLIEYFPQPPLDFDMIEDTSDEIYSLAKKTMAVDVKKDLSILDFAKNLQTLIKLKKGK